MSLQRGILRCTSGLLTWTLGVLPAPPPAAAQRNDEPETVILSLEEGTILFDRSATSLPWARSASGPLVALAPVVTVLGGDLDIGPLGEAHTLQAADRRVVLGPLSRTLTVDGEIHDLSIRPWLEPAPPVPDDEAEETDEARLLFVPVDALARAYPETLGYGFDFDPRRGLLRVSRTGEPRIDVDIDRVHDLGATTLVVTFSRQPRFQLERYRAGVRLRLLSGVMDPRRRTRSNDPLVRWIEVRERTIDIGLRPRAEASEPYLVGRPPRVQLVLDITRGRVDRRPTGAPPAETERSEFRIVLDPGHGGADNGVAGPFGEREKSLALGIARALGSHLESDLDARVVFTRSGDSTVTLEHRTSLANQYGADLFLSLHVTAAPGTRPGSAFQTWLLDPPPAPREAAAEAPVEGERAAIPETAEEAPAREDIEAAFEDEAVDGLMSEPDQAGTQVAIRPLQPWNRVQDRELERSELLARLIQTRVSNALDLPDRRVRRAPLRVLTGASMPAVLIEFGYETGEDEATPVFEGQRGREVIEAIGRAIRLYRRVVQRAENTAPNTAQS